LSWLGNYLLPPPPPPERPLLELLWLLELWLLELWLLLELELERLPLL
jgi:hypothetical protein